MFKELLSTTGPLLLQVSNNCYINVSKINESLVLMQSTISVVVNINEIKHTRHNPVNICFFDITVFGGLDVQPQIIDLMRKRAIPVDDVYSHVKQQITSFDVFSVGLYGMLPVELQPTIQCVYLIQSNSISTLQLNEDNSHSKESIYEYLDTSGKLPSEKRIKRGK